MTQQKIKLRIKGWFPTQLEQIKTNRKNGWYLFSMSNDLQKIIKCKLVQFHVSLIINVWFFFLFFLELKKYSRSNYPVEAYHSAFTLINKDTLYVLVQFLGLVAEHVEDRIDDSGRTNSIY